VTPEPVMAVHDWPSNAELIADCARLGYLHEDWLTLDPTYGMGTFWKVFRPRSLVAHDIDPAKAPDGALDVTYMAERHAAETFDAVVFDPPYKLNGTPTDTARYGVHVARTWAERKDLMGMGFFECVVVLKSGGYLLVKCQNQVCSGKVRWQTDWYARWARAAGLEKVDELHMLSYRPQPSGRRQVHARRNHSTMLVFRKP